MDDIPLEMNKDLEGSDLT